MFVRLHDPDRGRDPTRRPRPARHLTLASLRRNVSILFQEALRPARHGRREHRLRPPGRKPRADRGGRRAAGAAEFIAALAGRLRHRRRRARTQPLRRPAPAHRDRPGACSPTRRSWSSTSPPPASTPRRASACSRRCARLIAQRTTIVVSHDLLDRARRGPDRRPRSRTRGRARYPRRAARPQAVPTPASGQLHRTDGAREIRLAGVSATQSGRRPLTPGASSRRLRGDRAPAARQRPRRLRRLEHRARGPAASSRRCGRTALDRRRRRHALLHEGELLERFTHPHIVRAYER